MNYNRLYFLLLLFAFSLGTPGLAQKRCISQDWNFCRISDETSKAEIKNQGSDWSSQYNVQHMEDVYKRQVEYTGGEKPH